MLRTRWGVLVVPMVCAVVMAPAGPAAAYEDGRDTSASKAKSDLKQLYKKLTEIEEGLAEKPERTVAREDWIKRRYEDVDKLLARIAEKDPSWDLSKEKAHYAGLKKKVEAATAAVALANRDEAEPDPGEVTIEPIAGAPTITAGKPDWCDGVTIEPVDRMLTKNHYPQFLALDDVVKPAQHACRAPDFGKRQQWSAHWRQAIANQTGADTALISRFYRVSLAVAGDPKQKAETCAAYGAAKGSAPQARKGAYAAGGGGGAGAGQRAARADEASFQRATGIALGCGQPVITLDENGINDMDLLWWVDRGVEPPSELVRAVLVLSNIGHFASASGGGATKGTRAASGDELLRRLGKYALVAADVARLDEAKFRKELAAMKLNEYGQVMAELTFRRAVHMGRVYKAAYAGMDKGIGELAFKVAVAGFAAWEQAYGENKAGLDLAAEVEGKLLDGRISEVKDCHERAHAAYTSYLGRAAKGKGLDDVKAAAVAGIGYTLVSTSMICAAYEGRLGTAWILYINVMKYAPQVRGPRFAAYAAVLDAYGAIKAKDQGFPLGERDLAFWVHQPTNLVQDAASTTHNQTGIVQEESGRVKSVKKGKDGGLDLVFHQETRKVPTYNCVETNKIDRVEADGTVRYRTICTETGSKTVDITTQPFSVPAAFAAGIAPGVVVTAFVEGNGKGQRMGIPTEVTDGKKLVAYLGAAL